MAKVKFSLYEIVFNDALIGKTFYPDPNDDTVTEVIAYVKAKKDIRTINVVCQSGEVYPMNIDKMHFWEVNNENPDVAPTRGKMKGE